MNLPVINGYPLFDITIPSTKREIKVRQMLVRDEKILLMAKSSDPAKQEQKDIFNGIKLVVQNCISTPDVNSDDFALFDLEYMFMKLRQYSVASTFDTAYNDIDEMNEYNGYQQAISQGIPTETVEVPQSYKFTVDLTKVEVKFPEKITSVIEGPAGIRIYMRYPKATLYNDEQFKALTDVREALDMLIVNSIDHMEQAGAQFKPTKEELRTFLDQLPVTVNDKLLEYVQNLPKLHYEMSYTNKFGKERKITLNTLSDFFSF